MVMKVIILPGNGNSHPNDCRYQFVQLELQKIGYEVILEQMPDAELARASYWIPRLVDKIQQQEDVILIGHSSWAEAILKYLEQYKVKGAVLVWAQYTDLGIDTEKQSEYYDTTRKRDNIKANAWFILQFASVDDPYIPIDEAHTIRDQLQTEYYEFTDKGHFMQHDFPELIQALKFKTDMIVVTPITNIQEFNQDNTTSSSTPPPISQPNFIPTFQYDDEEIKPSARRRRTWILPLIVLILLWWLWYQKYSWFYHQTQWSWSNNSGINIIAIQSNTGIVANENLLDNFLTQEGLSDTWKINSDTWSYNWWNTWLINTWSIQEPKWYIPDLQNTDQIWSFDDTVQIVPLSTAEIAKVQKQYTDTKKISQTAWESEKKLHKNFGVGEILVEFIWSADHQQDRLYITKWNETKTFAAGYLWQGTKCYARNIGIFGVASQFIVYPTNCNSVYVFDIAVSKSFVKEGQIIYFHNKQIIIGIKSPEGYSSLYTYDNSWRKQLKTNTVTQIRTDNRGVYLIEKDSVLILDINGLNTITTISVPWFKIKWVIKDENFAYIILEKPKGGIIIQKYNLIDSKMVWSSIVSSFNL
jgi:predicted alpha/beta hydrolase family esterase